MRRLTNHAYEVFMTGYESSEILRQKPLKTF